MGTLKVNVIVVFQYGWIGYFFDRILDIPLISNAGYPVPTGYLANIRNPENYRIFGWITGYPALKISRISGILIVLISGTRSDIDNGRISGPTLFSNAYLFDPRINMMKSFDL